MRRGCLGSRSYGRSFGKRPSRPWKWRLKAATARRLQAEYLATPGRATELELVGSAPVVYPPDALERAVEGWVDLDFVVDRNGQPQNVAVTQSAPPGRFDAAARAAVEQYRYVPFERDGRVYERRVRLRVRFDIQ